MADGAVKPSRHRSRMGSWRLASDRAIRFWRWINRFRLEFVGVKMLVADLYSISGGASLLVVGSILAVSILASLNSPPQISAHELALVNGTLDGQSEIGDGLLPQPSAKHAMSVRSDREEPDAMEWIRIKGTGVSRRANANPPLGTALRALTPRARAGGNRADRPGDRRIGGRPAGHIRSALGDARG